MNKEVRLYIGNQYMSVSKFDGEFAIEIGTEPEDSHSVSMASSEINEFIEVVLELADRSE